LPVAVGFGVKTAAHARAVANGADGVVVGSALVEAVRQSLDGEARATEKTVSAVTDLVRDIAEGVKSARPVTA
jgi:tryptophan synthase alpha chain